MLLQKGDIIELKEGHRVCADVPMHFIYTNKCGNFSLCHHDVTLRKQFAYLMGKYIVINTTSDGGGTGHGPHDIYPDGYHVWCQKVDNPGIKVDFYQTGSFCCMISEGDIKPIGKAKITETWEIIE